MHNRNQTLDKASSRVTTTTKRDFGLFSIPAGIGAALSSVALGGAALGGAVALSRRRDKRRRSYNQSQWKFSTEFLDPVYDQGGLNIQQEFNLFARKLDELQGIFPNTATKYEQSDYDEFPDDDVIVMAIQKGCDTISWRLDSGARVKYKMMRLYIPPTLLTNGQVHVPYDDSFVDRMKDRVKTTLTFVGPNTREQERVDRIARWKDVCRQTFADLKTVDEFKQIMEIWFEKVKLKMSAHRDDLLRKLRDVDSRVESWTAYIQHLDPQKMKVSTAEYEQMYYLSETSPPVTFEAMAKAVLGDDCQFSPDLFQTCRDYARRKTDADWTSWWLSAWSVDGGGMNTQWKGDELHTNVNTLEVNFLKFADFALMRLIGGCVCKLLKEFLPLQAKIDNKELFSNMQWFWKLLGRIRVSRECDFKQILQDALRVATVSRKQMSNQTFVVDGDVIFTTDANGSVSDVFDQTTPLSFEKMQNKVPLRGFFS